MKIAIYSPYLDTLGGGEKYMLTIAEFLSENNEVNVLLDSHLYSIKEEDIKSRAQNLHGINLSKVSFKKAPLGMGSSFLERLFFLRQYDYLFYLTDGSIFFSTAKKNVLHFQSPLPNQQSKGLLGKIKLFSWKMAIYNSEFTKNIIEGNWPIKGRVVYPPVSINLLGPLKKKNQIVSVGFFAKSRLKKHEFLVNVFKTLTIKDISNWSLHIAGGASESDDEYINYLKKLAGRAKVYFHPNISLTDLIKLYGQSSIYWHAMGFGESDPIRFEHFGISTVEAMASGCVPVVIKKGGQLEIVEHGKSGFLWNTPEELINLTKKIIADKNLRDKISQNAIARSKIFSKDKFCSNIKEVINGDI